MRNILEAWKRSTENMLEGTPLDLIAQSAKESTNDETGEVSKYVRLDVEVPRGYDELSRCRFSVKIPNGKLQITDKELEEAYYTVTFQGLSVSYVDTTKGVVYFRAVSYAVKKED